MIGQLRNSVIGKIAAALCVLLGACASGKGESLLQAGAPPTSIDTSGRALPALPAGNVPGPKALSAAAFFSLRGNECAFSHNATEQSGNQLRLESTADDYAFAAYQFLDADLHSESPFHGLQISVSTWSGPVWLGYSSYVSGNWVWQQLGETPPDSSSEALVPADAELYSSEGTAWVALVAAGGADVTISQVRLYDDALGIQNFDHNIGTSAYSVQLSWSRSEFASMYEVYVEEPGALPGSGSLLAELQPADRFLNHGLETLGQELIPTVNEPPCEYAHDYQYSIRVRASHEGQDVFGPFSTLGPARRELQRPVNVVASQGQSADSISVFWDPVAEAASYALYREGEDTAIASVSACDGCSYESAADSSSELLDAQPRSYTVRAFSAPGESQLSEAAIGFTGPVDDYIIASSLDLRGELNFLLEENGEPVILAFDYASQSPVILLAQNSAPQDGTDWDWHALRSDITGLGEHCGLTLSPQGTYFAAVLSDASGSQTWFARSSDLTPESSSDWTFSLVDSANSAEDCSISRLGDKFIIACHVPGMGLDTVRASVVDPDSPEDWVHAFPETGSNTGLHCRMASGSHEAFYWAETGPEEWALRRFDFYAAEAESIEDVASSTAPSPLASYYSPPPALIGWDVTFLSLPGEELMTKGWRADGGPGGFSPRASSSFPVGKLFPGAELEDVAKNSDCWAWTSLDHSFGSQLAFVRNMYRNFRTYRVPSGLLPFTANAGNVATGRLGDGRWFAAYTQGSHATKMQPHWRYELSLPPEQ